MTEMGNLQRMKDAREGNVGWAVLGAALCSFFVTAPALGAKVVAEKNCSVRIDEELRTGQKVFVVRRVGGKEKKIAVVQVSRSGKGISLGKVIQGNKNCAALKGLSVQFAGESGSSVASAKGFGLLPAVDADVQFQYIMFSGKGLHQRTEELVPPLNLFGFGLQLDAWPGLFLDRKSLLMQAFGVGVRFAQGMAIPEIDVSPPKDSKDQTVGKQQTNPRTILIEALGRFPYMDGKLATEARIGYLMHSFEHTLSVQGGLPRAPLRNVSYAGVSLGLKQRVRIVPMIRANIGLTFPVMLSGTADNTSEKTKDRTAVSLVDVKDASGMLIDASVDGIIGVFKGTAGLTYETYGSKVGLAEGGELTLDETYITLFIGAGVFL